MGNPKGPNWSNEEEVALVVAWMQHSEDCELGSNQRNMIFWRKVFDQFLSNSPRAVANGRQFGAVQAHFKKIAQATTKYQRCIMAADRARSSGQNQLDVVTFANARYQELHPKNRPFAWHHCFSKMRDFVKWQYEPTSTPTSTPTATDADIGTDVDDTIGLSANEEPSAFQPIIPRPRPPGRDKSKKAKHNEPNKSQLIEGVLQIAANTGSLTSDQREWMGKYEERKEKESDFRIMDKDLTTMSGNQRMFWEGQQRLVMAKWSSTFRNLGLSTNESAGNPGGSTSGGYSPNSDFSPFD